MFNYTILRNELFYVTNGKSIIKEINNCKVILVLDFLQKHTNRVETIGFSLEKLITYYGYKVSAKKGETIDQFKHILKFLQHKKMIEIINKINIDKIKCDTYIECILNNNCEHGFIQLFDDEMSCIFDYEKKLNKVQLLTLYCYFKSRIYKRSEGDELIIRGGRAETCFSSYDMIYNDIGISKTTAMKYVDILVELDLIRYTNAGLWYYPSNPEVRHESPNIYCLYQGDENYCKTNLKQGVKQYRGSEKNLGKIWINNREYKHNNRRLNGKKGSIIKKINKGTITEQEKIELDEINKLIDGEIDEQARLTELFKEIEKIGYLTLSDYYNDEKVNEELYNKYFKIECDLGLYDDKFELIVNYEYYKWVMINYQKDKHDYYKNCVSKHVREIKDNKTKGKGLLANKKKEIKTPFGGFFKDMKCNEENHNVDGNIIKECDDWDEIEQILGD